ncbi:Lysine histidine transporter 1 [Bienertia sinuspersici]
MVDTESRISSSQQKDIDDWLPITSNRNAKWWYSAFHNVTAMVGAGGSRSDSNGIVMDNHPIHLMANG